MTDLSIPNAFTSGTSIIASEMNANFDAVETMINATGVPVLQDGIVTAAKIASDAVTNAKLASDAVDSLEIKDAAVTTPKLSSNLASQIGLSGAGASDKRRGYVHIDTEESTTSTTYTKLSTADEVASIVVPTGGLVQIYYTSLFKLVGATNEAKVALFIGSNQLKMPKQNAVPSVAEYPLYASYDTYGFLYSSPVSFGFYQEASGTSDSSIVDTGMLLGSASNGPITLWVAPGTYTFSVQFKVNSTAGGTLYVKSRKLWVEVVGF